MIKAGSIAGAVMFVLVVLSAAVVSPFCALCGPVVAGLLAGYLTGVFEKPAASVAAKRCAGAGAIAGGMAFLGADKQTLIDTTQTCNPNEIIGQLLMITSGKGEGQIRYVQSVSGPGNHILSLSAPWVVIPNNTSRYKIGGKVWEKAHKGGRQGSATSPWTHAGMGEERVLMKQFMHEKMNDRLVSVQH